MKRALLILQLMTVPAAAEEIRVWNGSPHDAAMFEIDGLSGGPLRIEAGQELVFQHPGSIVSFAGPSFIDATNALRRQENATTSRRRSVRSVASEPATRVRVGGTATFTGSHRVSGVASIIDSRTIRVTNLRHDGTAPGLDIRLGLSTQSRRNFAVVRIMGNQTYGGDTLDITLPENVDLNSFDTFTVWCYVFNVVIADAPFRD